MLKTLRNRLILSHVLPLLIIIPLLGIFLLYALETRVFIPGLISELEEDAILISKITSSRPEIWNDSELAYQLLLELNPRLSFLVTLIKPDGQILATTIPERGESANIAEAPELETALQGQLVHEIRYSQVLQGEAIDILAPVFRENGQMLGVVQILDPQQTLLAEFLQVRYLISGMLVAALLAGAILGYALALSISKPISKVTQAVNQLAEGIYYPNLRVHGPEEIRRLFESVNKSTERLHSLEQSRQKLLANLVHELGRPLGALRAAIGALDMGAHQDPVMFQELLAGMDDETARLQHLLDELAHLHTRALGTLELEFTRISVSDWLSRLLIPWEQVAREKHIEWQQDIPAGLPAVEADADRLAQAVGNLVANAVKYTPEGGKVTVRAGQEDHMVWVRVKDTGPGIASDEQKKVFTPFYRSEQGKRFPQGLGLGLSIAREVALAHRGLLELKSHPGEGSIFTIWFPIQQKMEESP